MMTAEYFISTKKKLNVLCLNGKRQASSVNDKGGETERRKLIKVCERIIKDCGKEGCVEYLCY